MNRFKKLPNKFKVHSAITAMKPGSKEYKGDTTDTVRPTIRLYMLCIRVLHLYKKYLSDVHLLRIQ